MPDITLTCKEHSCKAPFTVSAAEQKWFEEKGLALPKRCKECRQARKAQTGQVSRAQPEPLVVEYVEPPPRDNHEERGGRRRRDFDRRDRRSRHESFEQY